MLQQQIAISEQTVTKIMKETKQQFADCQRKDYYVHARILPPGYVFADRIDQPVSYKAIIQTFRKPIVPMQAVPADLASVLKQNGCYVTEANSIAVCGTCGELSLKSVKDFLSEYTLDSTIPKDTISTYLSTDWRRVLHKGDNRPFFKGVYIPKKYVGALKNSYNVTTFANHPDVTGHGIGDVLVMLCDNASKVVSLSQGIIINNSVFLNTYNQNVGGWAIRGVTHPSCESLPWTTDRVKRGLVL